MLKSNKIGDADANRARTVGQEAPLPGGAPTGAGIVSAAVSSVGTLAGSGGGAASASYARSAHGDIRQPVVLGSTRRAEDSIDVLDPLADGDYLLTVTDPAVAAPAVARAVVAAGADVLSIGEASHSLEDVYLLLVDPGIDGIDGIDGREDR